jgi:hypothetical protein
VKVTLFTDPGCPFGFNAQRQELEGAGAPFTPSANDGYWEA